MEQVIENLVENAIKYGPDEEAPSIEIGEVDGQARIAVVDRGVGIPDAERERIFERFFRASNVQSVTDTGLGLGLYICRRIIDEHGGRIWHEPTPGGGSTFVITLPLETDRPAADVADDDERPWQRPVSAEAAADA
jgi:signal transduction histidine kinase